MLPDSIQNANALQFKLHLLDHFDDSQVGPARIAQIKLA